MAVLWAYESEFHHSSWRGYYLHGAFAVYVDHEPAARHSINRWLAANDCPGAGDAGTAAAAGAAGTAAHAGAGAAADRAADADPDAGTAAAAGAAGTAAHAGAGAAADRAADADPDAGAAAAAGAAGAAAHADAGAAADRAADADPDAGAPQPPAQQVPQPMPVQVPPQIAQQTPTPMQVPPQPPAQQVPQPMPVQVPPQIAQQTPTPMQVPPQPPAQQVPQPMPVQVPPQIAQQTPTPMQVPPQPPAQQVPVISQPHPGHVTGQQLTTGPTSGGAGTSVTKPAGTVSKIKTEHLPGKPVPQRPQVALVPGKQPPSTLGPTQPVQPHHVVLAKPNPVSVAASTWTTEITEPGLENRQVELYRSEDAEEVLYQDVIPMDKTGFHLTVFGLRAPSYATAP